MSDRTNHNTLAFRILLVIAAFALAAAPAEKAFGESGIDVALALAIGAVGLLAYGELSNRTLLLKPRTEPVVVAPVVEDHWRSDRWVQDSVTRGMRALEEWRLEQRDA